MVEFKYIWKNNYGFVGQYNYEISIEQSIIYY